MEKTKVGCEVAHFFPFYIIGLAIKIMILIFPEQILLYLKSVFDCEKSNLI